MLSQQQAKYDDGAEQFAQGKAQYEEAAVQLPQLTQQYDEVTQQIQGLTQQQTQTQTQLTALQEAYDTALAGAASLPGTAAGGVGTAGGVSRQSMMQRIRKSLI